MNSKPFLSLMKLYNITRDPLLTVSMETHFYCSEFCTTCDIATLPNFKLMCSIKRALYYPKPMVVEYPKTISQAYTTIFFMNFSIFSLILLNKIALFHHNL